MKLLTLHVFLIFSAVGLALLTQSLTIAGDRGWEVNSYALRDLNNTEIKNTLISAGVDNQELVWFVEWSNYRIYFNVRTTADNYAFTIQFVPENREFYLRISSFSGASGELYAFVPEDLIPTPENVEVYLDNQPLSCTITNLENHYVLHSDFTFSERLITIKLPSPSGSVPQPWYGQPVILVLVVVMLAVMIVIAIGAVYWLKFRR